MKKRLFSLAIGALLTLGAVGMTYADNTLNVGADKTYRVIEYVKSGVSGVSFDRATQPYALSEMEKANNALARVMGRTTPHVQPATVYHVGSGQKFSSRTTVKRGKTIDFRFAYER